jgi:hypothetical protein
MPLAKARDMILKGELYSRGGFITRQPSVKEQSEVSAEAMGPYGC